MKTIAILAEGGGGHPTTFHAITAGRKADGRTPGEALDALTSQLGAEESGAAVILQPFLPDRHFSAEQSERLSTLMARWRAARETGRALPPSEQSELERLVDEELEGSAERAAEMSRELETAQAPRRRPPHQEGAGLQGVWARRILEQLPLTIFLGSLLVVGYTVFSIFDQIGVLIDGQNRPLRILARISIGFLLVNLLFYIGHKLTKILGGISIHIEFAGRRDQIDDSADRAEQKRQLGDR